MYPAELWKDPWIQSSPLVDGDITPARAHTKWVKGVGTCKCAISIALISKILLNWHAYEYVFVRI